MCKQTPHSPGKQSPKTSHSPVKQSPKTSHSPDEQTPQPKNPPPASLPTWTTVKAAVFDSTMSSYEPNSSDTQSAQWAEAAGDIFGDSIFNDNDAATTTSPPTMTSLLSPITF